MPANMPANTNLVDLVDRDQQIFSQRLAGKSVRAIAREFKISMKEVDDIIEAYCTPIDAKERARTFQLDSMRVDEMQYAAYPKARKGNISAIAAVTKLMERRAAMFGNDAPIRHDPIQVLAQAQPLSSTDKIEAVLNELADRKKLAAPDAEPGDQAADKVNDTSSS